MSASLFVRSSDLPVLKRDRVVRVASRYAPGGVIEDDYLWAKLMAAEADIARRLRVFLTPREMITPGTPQTEIDALVAAGETVVSDPGYDYQANMFQGNAWGIIEVRHHPVISVASVIFAYPSQTATLFSVPLPWLRIDKKYGRINIVPAVAQSTMAMSSLVLSTFGGGRDVPLMVQVRYRAGLANARADYPDLVDLIYRAAVLSLIEDEFMPASGSVSADGLSQSVSWDSDKYHDLVDKKTEALRQSIHGIRCMVV